MQSHAKETDKKRQTLGTGEPTDCMWTMCCAGYCAESSMLAVFVCVHAHCKSFAAVLIVMLCCCIEASKQLRKLPAVSPSITL